MQSTLATPPAVTVSAVTTTPNQSTATVPGVVTCAAIMGSQNGVRIFTGMMKAKDLVAITTVDHYKSSLPADDPNQGYQRPAERSRITKIGSHLIKEIINGQGHSGGLFPTAVILTSRKPLKFQNGQLTISDFLQITDGQHRIDG